MIKAVIFDIDNTLYCYDTAHTAAMEALHGYARAELGISPAELDMLLKEKQQQIKAELGDQAAIHNRGIRCLRVLEQLKMPLRHASRMEKLYWNTLISVSAPNPGVLECLKALKDGGYTLGIGSDMTLDFQLEKLERLGLIDFFDFIVTSEEAGCEKPNSRFFSLCARKAGAAPEECVFVGDNLKKDILGSMAVSMKAVWYTRKEQEQYPAVSHFGQLPGLISTL